MSDDLTDEPQAGWFVTDPDGNVVDSGPISEAQAAAWISELLATAENMGEQ